MVEYLQIQPNEVELASLASSDGSEVVGSNDRASDEFSVSSRGISPLNSPIRSPEGWRRQSDQERSLGNNFLSDDLSEITPMTGVDEVPKRGGRLTFWHGLGLVVGLQIGSGIFASPSQVNEHAGSVAASLIVWIISGLLAWTGAACYAELGSAIPRNGGTQAYLGYIFGPIPAFMFAWTATTILKPGSMGIISLVFGEYVARGIGFEDNVWVSKLFSIATVVTVTALNAFSTHLGASTGTVFFFLKIGLLLFIFIVGMVAIPKYGSQGSFSIGIFEGTKSSLGEYAIALYSGLWAYDGWDNLNFVSGEMKNPHRDLPRVISTSMPLVILAYIAANVAYYVVLTGDEINSATSVSLTMMKKVLGLPGRAVTSFLIAASCFGATNATTFSASRLIKAAADEKYFPSIFGRLSRWNTPFYALLLQASMTMVYILSGEFRSLTTFYGAASYMFYLWAVIGLLILRFKEPDMKRPYKVWITTPILFTIVAMFLILRTVLSKPLVTLGMVAFICLSIPIYFIRTRWFRNTSSGEFQEVPTN